ncbi:hypothetical protein [Ancylobacter defluvii]|uniref:Beta-1-3, beta-1-6-glucan biosynthesis protein n=1 Tax=Ancylobacter defluvii TaxID=1282440 RepID=A0A9W6K2J8_9HYPH|nr:hypothetical protein [Ancylobacter defluvii]MBS7587009.1 hypothetical protein [Ancylobacter defluvii]GLK86314.1 hypothetical protein GCM10017653_43840 [Ancylobacter defluvii]
MLCSVRPFAAALLGGLLLTAAVTAPAFAQNSAPEQKPAEQQSPEEQAKEAQRRSIEEYNEAAKLPGNAGLPECVWSGRRIAMLLWRDDIDTARRHMELYERFGCPTEHLKIAFRCLVRQGNIDPKAQERLSERVHACWVNPDSTPAAPAAPAAAPAAQ